MMNWIAKQAAAGHPHKFVNNDVISELLAAVCHCNNHGIKNIIDLLKMGATMKSISSDRSRPLTLVRALKAKIDHLIGAAKELDPTFATSGMKKVELQNWIKRAIYNAGGNAGKGRKQRKGGKSKVVDALGPARQREAAELRVIQYLAPILKAERADAATKKKSKKAAPVKRACENREHADHMDARVQTAREDLESSKNPCNCNQKGNDTNHSANCGCMKKSHPQALYTLLGRVPRFMKRDMQQFETSSLSERRVMAKNKIPGCGGKLYHPGKAAEGWMDILIRHCELGSEKCTACKNCPPELHPVLDLTLAITCPFHLNYVKWALLRYARDLAHGHYFVNGIASVHLHLTHAHIQTHNTSHLPPLILFTRDYPHCSHAPVSPNRDQSTRRPSSN